MYEGQMTDVPTERAEDIYYSALEIKLPDQRKVYLDRMCQGDAELRWAVERMLASQPEAEKFFSEGGVARLPMGGLAQSLAETPGLLENIDAPTREDESIGKCIG